MDNARIELIAPTGERLVISERNARVVHHNIKNMRIVSKAYGPDHSIWVKRYMQP